MKKILLLPVACLFSLAVHAQIGTSFWFAAPNVNDSHADEPISINISTLDLPATVTVSIPSNPAFTPITRTIPANTFEVIVLECHNDTRANPPHYNCISDPVYYKNMLETNVLNTAQNKGLYVSSTEDISVYYQVLGSNCNVARCKIANGDIFSLKGDNALGQAFHVNWQNGHGIVTTDFWNDVLGGKQGTSLYIVATEDNTAIDITPSVNLVGGYTAGNLFTINLNAGQTYAIQSTGYAAGDHLSGTTLDATKPIAVTVIDDTPADRSDFAANANKPEVYDLVGDQLIPNDYAGTEYIVSKFYAYVTCIEDNTEITVTSSSGTTVVTRQNGQTYEVDLTSVTGPAYIQTSKPTLLFHLRGILGLDDFPEFGGAVVPPIICTGSRSVRFSRATNEFAEQFYLTVLVKSSGVNDFLLNGNSTWIQASDFSAVPGTTDWMYMDKEFNTTQIPPFQASSVINTKTVFHLGVVYGRPHIDKVLPYDSVSTGCQYGYFSSFGAAKVELPNLSSKCLLPDESLIVNPGAYSAYTWYSGSNIISSASTLSITEDGDYSLMVTDISGCEDSVGFSVQLGNTPTFNLGEDLYLCPSINSTLGIVEGSGGDGNFQWYFQRKGETSFNPLTTNTTAEAVDPGIYVLQVSSPGCGTFSDTIVVGKWAVVVPNLFTPNEDGHNDYFEVLGIEEGEWRLRIYNRWGDRVYFSEGYKNDWDGKSPEGKAVGEGLYYFELIEKESEECNHYKGWLQLMK